MNNKKNLKIADAISLLKEWEKDGLYKIPRNKFADYNWLRRKMTQLSQPRLRTIMQVVSEVADSACPKGTIGFAIKQYMLYAKTNHIAEYPLDDELRYCFLQVGDDGEKKVAVFQYETDEDGGLPVYESIRIPLMWLEGFSVEEVKVFVLKQIYKELCRYIYRREKELEYRKVGKEKMYLKCHEFLEDDEIKALEVKEDK